MSSRIPNEVQPLTLTDDLSAGMRAVDAGYPADLIKAEAAKQRAANAAERLRQAAERKGAKDAPPPTDPALVIKLGRAKEYFAGRDALIAAIGTGDRQKVWQALKDFPQAHSYVPGFRAAVTDARRAQFQDKLAAYKGPLDDDAVFAVRRDVFVPEAPILARIFGGLSADDFTAFGRAVVEAYRRMDEEEARLAAFEQRGADWYLTDGQRVCGEIECQALVIGGDEGSGKRFALSNGRRVFVPNADLADVRAVVETLLDAGADVELWPQAKTALPVLCNSLSSTRIVKRITQPGRQSCGTFVFPLDERAEFEWVTRPQKWIDEPRGYWECWFAGIRRAVDNGLDVMAVSALFGLAGPVLARRGYANKGLYFGGPTSSGKSSAQIAQVSAWTSSEVDKGNRVTAKATINGMEYPAACSNGTTFAVDDLGNGGEGLAQSLQMMLAEGRGKKRMGPDGSARRGYSFEGMTFSLSGELSPQQYAAANHTEGLQIAGAAVRCPYVDFSQFPVHPDPDIVEQVRELFEQSFGVAGPVFLDALNAVSDETFDAYFKQARDVFKVGDLSPAQRRASEVFQAVYVVGHVCEEARLFQDLDDAPEWHTCVEWEDSIARVWHVVKSSADFERLDVGANATTQLLEWLSTSADVAAAGAVTYKTPLAYRDPVDPRLFYLPTGNLAKLPIGTTPAAAVDGLKASGNLIARGGGNRWTHDRIPGIAGKVRHYRIEVDQPDPEPGLRSR